MSGWSLMVRTALPFRRIVIRTFSCTGPSRVALARAWSAQISQNQTNPTWHCGWIRLQLIAVRSLLEERE